MLYLTSLASPNGNVADILIREVLAIPYKPGFRAYQQRATYWCPEQGRGPTSPVISEELLWSKAIA